MEKYDHKKIEAKWQKYWEKEQLNKAVDFDKKPKFYGLIEFPYPSGEGLHVGHIRSNTAMDIICRQRRMQGYNVLYPIGWDAFGLPTENYAIKTGTHPIKVTKRNTDTFRRQLKELGFSFDWSREIDTTDPAYYKWTQWIFLQFLKRGLAYKKKLAINWCPSCKIGLANEEVVEGRCERCGTPVEKRDKEQWLLAITKYADRLDRDLDEAVFSVNLRTLPKKLLVGTRNLAKVKMFKEALAGMKNLEIVSLNDLPEIDDSALKEGDDFRANARIKSEFYFKKTGLPTVSTDQIQWVENWPKNDGFILHARQLANPRSPRATDGEVGAWIEKLVDKYGESKATFHYAISYTDKYGTNDFISIQRDYLLQKKKSPKTNDGYVFDRYMKDLETKEYRIEQPASIAFSKFEEVIRGDFLNLFSQNGKTGVDYLEKIKIQQKNWIGRKEGINLTYQIKGISETVTVFTTRPDTNYGATFVVLAPEHELVEKITADGNKKSVADYVKEAKSKSEEERIAEGRKKTGVFTGRYAINHLTGKKMPIWVSDFVLAGFGTGAVVGVPGHDLRDFEFAQKFGLEIIRVVVGQDNDTSPITHPEQVQEEEGRMVNSDILNGLEIHEATRKIMDYMVEKGWGRKVVTYHLRDWIFSRQHYWGEPIPVVFCEDCKNRKYNFIFIHGYDSTCKTPWKLWLKKELEKRGHTFFGPELPNSATPDVLEQADFILKNANLGKDTIIIGHSLGGAVMMKVLEKAKTKIARAVFLDAALRPKFNDIGRSAVTAASDWKFNFKKIKKAASEFVVLADEDFIIIPKDQSEELGKLFDAKVIYVKPNHRHFSRAETEPEVLKLFTDEGMVPVPEKDLPVLLPEVQKYQPTDTGESPLAGIAAWVNTKCPRCGGEARRETDTMPNWAGSSWYYLRYTDPKNKNEFVNFEKLKYWTPVDWYNGGMEHTTLHLLYSRFWHKFLFDLGLVPTSEPYAKRTSHGMVLAEGGVKMSKSRPETIINPDDIIEKFGADALRIYEMFMGPFDQTVAWSTDGLAGAKRFLEKIWKLYEKVESKKSEVGSKNTEMERLMHKTIKKISQDIESMKFNTAISAFMILANAMEKEKEISVIHYSLFIILLAPFAPHIAEELWSELGYKQSVFKEKWPEHDLELVKDRTINLVIQVNGKVRDTMEVEANISEEEAKKISLEREKIKKWLEGKEVKKVIFVKGKLVNIVI